MSYKLGKGKKNVSLAWKCNQQEGWVCLLGFKLLRAKWQIYPYDGLVGAKCQLPIAFENWNKGGLGLGPWSGEVFLGNTQFMHSD